MLKSISTTNWIDIRTCVMVCAILLVGCDIDSGDNIPDVPVEGLFMFVEANLHEDEDSTQISAAVFRDGKSVDLFGGDVFEVRTDKNRVLLKERGRFPGSYTTSLPVDISIQNLLINVVHAPVDAREDRWYPIDIFNIDPGPGELVGKSATVNFPPLITITGPASKTVFTTINDVVDLTWVAGGVGDNMRVLSAIECTDGLSTTTYGTEIDVVDDDGLEAISMDKFIYDINDDSPILVFVSDAIRALLQELLNELSAGEIDPDFLVKQEEVNPVNSACEIRLFLQRQRDGQFDSSFDNGRIIGSRSAEVILNYLPPVSLNQLFSNQRLPNQQSIN